MDPYLIRDHCVIMCLRVRTGVWRSLWSKTCFHVRSVNVSGKKGRRCNFTRGFIVHDELRVRIKRKGPSWGLRFLCYVLKMTGQDFSVSLCDNVFVMAGESKIGQNQSYTAEK